MIAAGVGRGIADGVLHTARLFRPVPMAPPVDLTGRTFVVTGATRGSLGHEVARMLARWGGQVVATCRRDPVAMERSLNDGLAALAGHGSVTAQRLDLAERTSVEAFARFTEEHLAGRLHVLVNNAGILKGMFADREPRYAPDGVEVHWRTNYLGAFHLTRVLLPLLTRAARDSGDARLVNVASHQHVRAWNEWLFEKTGRRNSLHAYGLSKLAMVHMSGELHRRYGAAGDFRAVALHPGTIDTNMVAGVFGSHPRLAVLRPLLQPLLRRVLLTPAEGAQTVLWCATAPGVQGGRYYEGCAPARPSSAVLDERASARLWEASAQWADS